MNKKLILASSSPRRREILTRLGFEFEIVPSGADESGVCGSTFEIVRTLATRKAQDVAASQHDAIVIGCDTLVSVDDRQLGKPADSEDAVRMLRMLSGRTHEVMSGLCIIDTGSGEMIADAQITKVRFKPLSAQEIEAYVDTKEPMDKAGAYAIQGGAGKFVEEIEGSFDNVMGFPTETFMEYIRKWQ